MEPTTAASTETTAPATTTATAAPQETAPATTTQSAFDWKSLNLSPDLQNVVDRHQFSDPAMVVKSYGEFEKLHGVPVDRLVKLPSPKEAGDPKAWDAVYNKLGRPETADKYVLPVPKGDDGTFANQIKPWLHEAGVTQAGAAKLAEKWNGFQEAQANAMKAEQEQRNATQIQELKLAWGGEYDTRVQLVDKAAETFGMSDQQVLALKQTLGTKGAMEFLYNIGVKIGVEDKTVPGMGGSQPTFNNMTPDMAKAEINRIKTDKDFARVMTGNDPKAKMDARRELEKLHQIAYPGSSSAQEIRR